LDSNDPDKSLKKQFEEKRKSKGSTANRQALMVDREYEPYKLKDKQNSSPVNHKKDGEKANKISSSLPPTQRLSLPPITLPSPTQ